MSITLAEKVCLCHQIIQKKIHMNTQSIQNLKIKELKKGYCVNHPKYGYVQYYGIATKHPYTEEPKIPHLHIFWQCVDEDGNTKQVNESNENLIVEVIDKIEINE